MQITIQTSSAWKSGWTEASGVSNLNIEDAMGNQDMKSRTGPVGQLMVISLIAALISGFVIFGIFSGRENRLRTHALAHVTQLIEATSDNSLGSERRNGEHLRHMLSGYFGDKVLVILAIDSHNADRLTGQWLQSVNFDTASTFMQISKEPKATDLYVKVQWQSPFAMIDDSTAWGFTGGIPLLILFITFLVTETLRRSAISPMSRKIDELAVKIDESQNLQMFAHDIRKPFSALRATLELLHKKRTSDEVMTVATRLLPEMDALLLHVDGMISDVIKKETANTRVSITVDNMFEQSIKEVARKHPGATHKIDWQLRHSLKIDAEEKPLIRAIANLVCNAIEATSPGECIWISTKDQKLDGCMAVEITIGNTGTPIPDEVLKNLFQPFFTSGKIGGTGLGLAYVKKTVEQIGGVVAVSSTVESGTEFSLILPAAAALDKITAVLPTRVNGTELNDRESPASGIGNIQNLLQKISRCNPAPVRILVIEDETFYFDSIVASVTDEIRPFTSFIHAVSVTTAIIQLKEKKFDLVICDYDLGMGHENGLTVVEYLRATSSAAKIYMHTNKTLTGQDAQFAERHTSGFLSKPANGVALLHIISDSLKLRAESSTKDIRPVVAIIDDDCFIRELWNMQSEEIHACLYSSPEEFLNDIKINPARMETFDAIVIDYYFDESSTYRGDQLARKIRHQVRVPIIISSDISDLAPEVSLAFDGRIEKSCQSWAEISRISALRICL